MCERFQDDGVVCPAQLRTGLYTVARVDNLDHNPSSNTAVGSFHGTGISLSQFPIKSNSGLSRAPITLKSSKIKTKHDLPDNYAIVPAVALNYNKVDVADQHMEKAELLGNFIEATFTERSWLGSCQGTSTE